MINVVFLNSLFWWSLVISVSSLILTFIVFGIGAGVRQGCLLSLSPLFAIVANISGAIFVIALIVKILFAIGILI